MTGTEPSAVPPSRHPMTDSGEFTFLPPLDASNISRTANTSRLSGRRTDTSPLSNHPVKHVQVTADTPTGSNARYAAVPVPTQKETYMKMEENRRSTTTNIQKQPSPTVASATTTIDNDHNKQPPPTPSSTIRVPAVDELKLPSSMFILLSYSTHICSSIYC